MAVLTMVVVGRRRLRRIPWWTWLIGLLALLSPVRAAPLPSPEYQVKAAFLFNFAQFVTWPAHTFKSAEAPVVLGVLGADPFGEYLDRLVAGETVGGRHIVVRRYRRVSEIDDCEILFVSDSLASRFNRILPALAGRPILTVGDAEEFVPAGGMVRFYTLTGKIRLQVNMAAVQAARLKISSKILRFASLVPPRTDSP